MTLNERTEYDEAWQHLYTVFVPEGFPSGLWSSREHS